MCKEDLNNKLIIALWTGSQATTQIGKAIWHQLDIDPTRSVTLVSNWCWSKVFAIWEGHCQIFTGHNNRVTLAYKNLQQS